MKDLLAFLKEVIFTSVERLKFPVFSSVLISWSLLNWQIILILFFSQKSIEERIAVIRFYHIDPIFNIWLPLLFGFCYVFGLPLLKKLLFMSLHDINLENWTDQMNYKIGSYQKRIELEKEERKLQLLKAENKDINELRRKIEDLEQEKIELGKTIDAYKKQYYESNELIDNYNNAKSEIERIKEYQAIDRSRIGTQIVEMQQFVMQLPDELLIESGRGFELVDRKYKSVFLSKTMGDSRFVMKPYGEVDEVLAKVDILNSRLIAILDAYSNRKVGGVAPNLSELRVLNANGIIWSTAVKDQEYVGLTDLGYYILHYLKANRTDARGKTSKK
ncbi:hypothetical protein [Lunatimonas salinarum]|uniref:hypothetical protein n=1 Tax=Lunatimonas salinarum TaxID=1774590 RepID=UPI001ADFB2AE|nr:hypothetical protein [Lunatimonas salinarum]